MDISLSSDELRPLVQQVVAETLAIVESERAELPEAVMSEAEVARMLRVKPHVIGDG